MSLDWNDDLGFKHLPISGSTILVGLHVQIWVTISFKLEFNQIYVKLNCAHMQFLLSTFLLIVRKLDLQKAVQNNSLT